MNLFSFFLVLFLSLLVFGGHNFVHQIITTGKLPFWPKVNEMSPLYNLTVSAYLSQKGIQLYRETFPWYWGVFKWLGVVLPFSVLRIIKIILAVSLIGIIKYYFVSFRKQIIDTKFWQVTFIIFCSIWYVFWLLYWDYSLIRSIGFSHGLQGRNFFPTLINHMTLIVFGIYQISEKKRMIMMKLIIFIFIFINIVSINTILNIYYDSSSINTLITQISQYKPWFIKGIGLVISFTIYLTVLLQFVFKTLYFKKENK
jgi:hypothetical protein